MAASPQHAASSVASFVGTPSHPSQSGKRLGLSAPTLVDLIRSVKAGLPFHSLETLADDFGLALPQFAVEIGVPSRTLARRKITGKLSPEESERVLRLAMLYDKTLALFGGNAADAREWLRQPKKALGGETPLAFSATELGAREVENLIGRLEHGVFS